MLSENQTKRIVCLFAQSDSEEAFDKGVKRLGLAGREYEDEIANLIYAIATNKPVPKQK